MISPSQTATVKEECQPIGLIVRDSMSERDRSRQNVSRRVSVKLTLKISPRMQRIVFEGPGLDDFEIQAPAQWVMLFFPKPDGTGFVRRPYTIRYFDREARELTIDFFLHEGGTVSYWVAEAKPGTEIEFGGPRSDFRIDRTADSYLLAGDETAIPGILSILEQLPREAEAKAYIEVSDAGDELTIGSEARIQLAWLHRGSCPSRSTRLLEDAVRQAALPAGRCQVWLAGETSTVHAVKAVLMREKGLDRSSIHASGYWKRGEASHKDPAGDD